MSTGRAGPVPRPCTEKGQFPAPTALPVIGPIPTRRWKRLFWPQKVVCSLLETSLLTRELARTLDFCLKSFCMFCCNVLSFQSQVGASRRQAPCEPC